MRNRLRRFFAPSLYEGANLWLNADQPEFSWQISSRCSAMQAIAGRALGFGVVVLVLIKDSLEWHYNGVVQLWVAMSGSKVGYVMPPLLEVPESVLWGILIIAVVVGFGMVIVVIARTVALLCIRNQGWHLNLGMRLVAVLWLIALILSLNHPLLLPWVWGILALVCVLMSGLLWCWSNSLERALKQDLPYQTNNGEYQPLSSPVEKSLQPPLETIVLGANLWVQPEPLAQQPPQFAACLLWLLGLFCWTMADFAPWFKGWVSIIMIAAGISGVSSWRMGLLRLQRAEQATIPPNQSHQHPLTQHDLDINLWFDFRGWWGTQAQYVLPLQEFQQLWRVQLQEGGPEVEISWLKLVGDRREVILPSLLTGIAARPPLEENESEITLGSSIKALSELTRLQKSHQPSLHGAQIKPAKRSPVSTTQLPSDHNTRRETHQLDSPSTNVVDWLCHHSHFVVQERLQDSLSLIGILIPQGAGILAGILLLLIGLGLSLIVEPMAKFMPEYTLGLLCLSGFSPWLGRQIYDQLAPNALAVVWSRGSQTNGLRLAEVAAGSLILLIATVGHNYDQQTLVMFLVQILSWLCVLVGAEVFRWVQRVPLVEKI